MFIASLILIAAAGSLLVLAPAMLFFAYYSNWAEVLSLTVDFFHEVYFNVLPWMLLTGILFLFKKRLTSEQKKGLAPVDFFWLSILLISSAIFIWTYVAPVESIINQVDSIIPPLGLLAPNLYSFLLWSSFFLFLVSFYFVYQASDRLGAGKTHVGSLFISFSIALGIAISIEKFPFMETMEESFVSIRYAALRDPSKKEFAPGLYYCPAPVDQTGRNVTVSAPNPPGVREDIEIIGVTNTTIEELQGNWPLDWSIYARLVDRFKNAKGNITLFDISFLDEKGVYGGNYCGSRFSCAPIGEYELKSQVEVLKTSIENANNTIISDYPVETSDQSRSSIYKYEERMDVLRRESELKHIKNGRFAETWAAMPLPPALPIAKALDGMGYANVLKDERGYNRWIPLVVRIKDRERAREPGYNPDIHDEYYPSIDLLLAAKYYGVDPVEDIEVDWLEGKIRIKNIPENSRMILNKETFEMEQKDIMAVPNPERMVTIPINQRGLMDINFRGGRYCFKQKELLETSKMSPEQAAQNFDNKITLIAMFYATGVGTAKDTHLSPYGDMAGIEHHAYGINTILNQDFVTIAPAWVDLLLILVLALILGLYQSRVSTWLNFVLGLFLSLVVVIVTMLVTFDMFSYMHVFPSLIVEQFIIFVSFIGFRVLTEEENVKFIRNTFSKFVSQDVVEELLANPDAISLGGSKKEVSVFFSDVRGFTTISEALGPEELVALLNEYLTVMTELIIDYRGTIDKYMGDAIMAFWGAPAQNDDHAYYTCVAAIAQVQALKEMQTRWAERNIPVLDIGVGVNSGPAVVGNMGSSRRMDYTLMGDTVNLGSRLEGITKTYGVKICISEYTYERVKDRVYARELDLVRVKGKLEPVRIYELMGLKDDQDLERLRKTPGH